MEIPKDREISRQNAAAPKIYMIDMPGMAHIFDRLC